MGSKKIVKQVVLLLSTGTGAERQPARPTGRSREK